MLPIIPLKSRIAALPGLGPITSLGSISAVTLVIAYTIGPVSWAGYFPAAFAGAFVGVLVTMVVLGLTGAAIGEVNGAPFQKGDRVQVLNGKHKGVIGEVEETDVGQHEVYVAVDVDGETTLYDDLGIYLIERIGGEAPAN